MVELLSDTEPSDTEPGSPLVETGTKTAIGCSDDDLSSTEPGSPLFETCSEPSAAPSLASRDTAAGEEDDSDMIDALFSPIGCIDDDPSDTEPGSPSLETCSEPSSTLPLVGRELSHDIMSAQDKNEANQRALGQLCLREEVSDAAAGKEDDTDMIDDALKQLARKAIARRSRRAARKESRRQLRAELKAVHHELRAERKAAPAIRVVKTGSDVLNERKRKAIAKMDDVLNERKLKGKDPILARCDDVLNERKRERKAVRRALRAERKTERERKRERKAVRLALRAERKAERVGRQPDVNCEQSEKKAGRGAAPSAPTHYTPFVPARVQHIARGKCAATCLACPTAEKAATNDEMEFPDYDADPVRDARQQDG